MGNSLILAGMAALSASVIGAPIASIVIIFELTHSYDIAFVAIICVAGSCLISSFVFGHSFFDKQLLNRDFSLSRGRTDILLSEISVNRLLGKNEYLTAVDTTYETLLKQFKDSEFTEAYLLNKENQLLGKIKVNDILKDKKYIKYIDKNPLSLKMTESVSEAITKASSFIGESIPVVDHENRLLGVVTEADLFSEYLSVQEKITLIEKD